MSSSAPLHPSEHSSDKPAHHAESPAQGDNQAIPSPDNQQTVISQRPPIRTSTQTSTGTGTEETAARPEIIEPGTRLGDIELTEHIGGGGMGQVYRGEDKRLDRLVAVKVLSRQQASDQEAVRRFLNEAKSAAKLNHQHIAQVYAAGESGGHPYIIFEYVHGINIRSMVEERGPLALEEALSYTLQIADALAHAAERRIVHRDVKPSNVLVDPSGQAKLIDLGLARLSTPDAAEGDLTASGVTLGTFDYISPEQARDPRNADSRSDIYSLGCTLFFMLAGRPPFPEGTVLQKLLQHQGDAPPDICQFRPDLPEEVGIVLGKMMAKDPRRRYPDSARLMDALLGLADMVGLHPTGPGQTIWLPPKESRITVIQRQSPWLAPTLALVCSVLGLHLLWSSQDKMREFEDVFDYRNLRPAVSTAQQPDVEPATRPSERPSPTPSAAPLPDPASTDSTTGTDQAEDAEPEKAADPTTHLGAEIRGISVGAQSLLPRRGSTPKERAEHEHSLESPLLVASMAPPGDAAGMSAATPFASTTASKPSTLQRPPVATPSVTVADVPAASAAPVIVTPDPRAGSQYPSVEAALAAKPAAELIELRYDGPRVETSLAVIDRRVTIRAGAGHSPILAFKPFGSDPVLHPRHMIEVGEGNLKLEGLTVELEIPRDMPSASWSLVRISTGGKVQLNDCSLRILNASDSFDTYHKDAAFFRVIPGEAGAGPGLTSSALLPRKSAVVEIGLTDSIACGEANLIRTSGRVPLVMNWKGGLVATTESALFVDGSNRKPSSVASLEVEWERVTAVTRDGLIHISTPPHHPHLAPIRFSEVESVLSSGDRPLIQAKGDRASPDLLDALTWNSRSGTIYEYSTFFAIEEGAPTEANDDEKIEEQRKTVGFTGSPQPLGWQKPTDQPMHAMEATDFVLTPAQIGSGLDAAQAPGYQPEVAGEPATAPSEKPD